MKIRKEQMDAFSEPLMRSFECRLVRHVEKVFPDECGQLGDEAVRQRVRKGIRDARKYGVVIEYDVARYVDLMFILSEDFDDNDEFPWARRILNHPDLDGRAKMDRLYKRTEAELKSFGRQAGQ
ncbi:MAG: hypothetical protein J7M21_01225 [Planctomycetes bacterium]|nr:hypothetical protein [Planctomycetota bacterium]